jgi:hypothetical protein
MTATLTPGVIRFNLSRDEQCTRCGGHIARGERAGFPVEDGPRFLCPGCCDVLEGGEPAEVPTVVEGRQNPERIADAVEAAEAAPARDQRHRVVRFQHGGPLGVLEAKPCAAGCGHTIAPAERAGRIGGVHGTACDACCTRWERGEPLACEADATAPASERPTSPAESSTGQTDAPPAADAAQTPPVAEPAGPATGETPTACTCTCTKRGGTGDGYTNRGDGVFVHAACGLPSPAVARGKARTVDIVKPAAADATVEPEVGDVAGVTKLEPAPAETPEQAEALDHDSAVLEFDQPCPRRARGEVCPDCPPVTPQQRARDEVEAWVADDPARSEQAAVATLAEQGLVTPAKPAAAARPLEAADEDEQSLDLKMWQPDAKHWGADPKTTLAELVDAVRRGILAGDLRGRQVEIGPSEVGHPCPRWLAYRLAGTPPTGTQGTPWRQRIGTLIHNDVDDHAHRDNAERGTRWLTGLKVTIGELYPGRPIRGTLDVFDVLTGTVIDVKCPGSTAMKTYGPGKPEAEQYRVQLQGYGRGVMLAGFLPAWVAALRLSPARELSEYIGKPERFDAGIAERALARAGGIARMVDQLGQRAPALLPMVQANCHRCDWYRPNSTDPTTGCPGAPGTRADHGSRRRASVDDLVG